VRPRRVGTVLDAAGVPAGHTPDRKDLPMRSRYDAIVIGAGHNGLVAASYLARQGLSVAVFERSERVGGACVTNEIIPGFKVSGAAQVLGMFRAEIIRDLELERHGLAYRLRDPEVFIPFPDGQHLFLYADAERTMASIARLSEHDAELYPHYDAYTSRIARVVAKFMLTPAPTVAEFASAFDGPDGVDMLQCALFASVEEYLSRFFESDYVKGPFSYGGLSGSAAGPRTPGTAFSKFYHTATGLRGALGTWALVRGGMGSVTQALALAFQTHGGEVFCGKEVAAIRYANDRATGIVLSDGTECLSDIVLSNADPKRTFLGLVPKEALPENLAEQVRRIRTEGTGFKINFALSELPSFAAMPGTAVGPQHTGGVMIAPSVDYLERAWDEAKYGRPSSQPFSQMFFQSATDPTLAPAGGHTLSMWGHHFPYRLREGDLDVERVNLRNRMIDLMTEYAPNFRRSVLACEVFLPSDLEREYGLTGGQIFHGELSPGQVLWGRPLPGVSGHGAPVPGLYLCGAGTHPGGDVSGAPGYNAARAVLRDLNDRRGKAPS
jgi:phytoene dehydrogenase-like protein